MVNYSEKMAYLPEFWLRTKWEQPMINPHKTAVAGVFEDTVVFGNMCAVHKYTPEMMDVWMIIWNNDNSVLWMFNPPCDETKDMIYFYAEKHGVAKDQIKVTHYLQAKKPIWADYPVSTSI